MPETAHMPGVGANNGMMPWGYRPVDHRFRSDTVTTDLVLSLCPSNRVSSAQCAVLHAVDQTFLSWWGCPPKTTEKAKSATAARAHHAFENGSRHPSKNVPIRAPATDGAKAILVRPSLCCALTHRSLAAIACAVPKINSKTANGKAH